MKNEIHAVIASLGMALIVNYVIWFGSSLNYHPDTPVLWLSFSIIYPFIYYIIFFTVALLPLKYLMMAYSNIIRCYNIYLTSLIMTCISIILICIWVFICKLILPDLNITILSMIIILLSMSIGAFSYFSVILSTKLPPNLDNQHWSNFTNRSINFIIKIGYISLIIIGILVISFGIFFIIIPLGTKY